MQYLVAGAIPPRVRSVLLFKGVVVAFDKNKDEELYLSVHEEAGASLFVSVRRYDGGEIKLQIGPRVVKGADGETKYRKVGRLSFAEWSWLVEQHEEITKAMTPPEGDW